MLGRYLSSLQCRSWSWRRVNWIVPVSCFKSCLSYSHWETLFSSFSTSIPVTELWWRPSNLDDFLDTREAFFIIACHCHPARFRHEFSSSSSSPFPSVDIGALVVDPSTPSEISISPTFNINFPVEVKVGEIVGGDYTTFMDYYYYVFWMTGVGNAG